MYHGHSRLVDPYTYGVDRKGHTALMAYQTGGTSGSGRIPDWRIFHLSEITTIAIEASYFVPVQRASAAQNKSFSSVIATL